MDIVVVGGAGFIGTNLVGRLIGLNHNVIVIDNYVSGNRSNHIEGVTYFDSDCRNIENILIGQNVDAVFHLGEYSKIVPSFKGIDNIIETNMYSTSKVIEYCRKYKIKLIYAGSSTKYSEDGANSSPYAFSKAKNTELIKNYSNWFGLKYSICYFYNNYGPYQDSCNDGWETVISIFEKQKRKGLPLSIVSPGTQRRNYTHVEDTIGGIIAAWKREENDEYQLGSSESFSMFELAELFECDYNFLPARPGDRMDHSSDLEDTYEKLNWKPKHKLKNWINEL
tara:strand:+ start:2480 stop:3322 length:843 start_codon:yes stop_codon:yes gene_type:complete